VQTRSTAKPAASAPCCFESCRVQTMHRSCTEIAKEAPPYEISRFPYCQTSWHAPRHHHLPAGLLILESEDGKREREKDVSVTLSMLQNARTGIGISPSDPALRHLRDACLKDQDHQGWTITARAKLQKTLLFMLPLLSMLALKIGSINRNGSPIHAAWNLDICSSRE